MVEGEGIKNHSTQQLDPIPLNPCWNADRQMSNGPVQAPPTVSVCEARLEEVGGVGRAASKPGSAHSSPSKVACGRRLQTEG